MNILLRDLKTGEEGLLLSVDDRGIFASRLRGFGLMEGTRICALGAAPGGSPLLFRVRGTVLALRKGDCAAITVVKL